MEPESHETHTHTKTSLLIFFIKKIVLMKNSVNFYTKVSILFWVCCFCVESCVCVPKCEFDDFYILY